MMESTLGITRISPCLPSSSTSIFCSPSVYFHRRSTSRAPKIRSFRFPPTKLVYSSNHEPEFLKSESGNPSSSFFCGAVTSAPSVDVASSKLNRLVAEPLDRVKRLLYYANLLPPLDDAGKSDTNRVMGCTAQVWLEAEMDMDGRMRFAADSDSEITRGFCACLVWVLDGRRPEEVLSMKIA